MERVSGAVFRRLGSRVEWTEEEKREGEEQVARMIATVRRQRETGQILEPSYSERIAAPFLPSNIRELTEEEEERLKRRATGTIAPVCRQPERRARERLHPRPRSRSRHGAPCLHRSV